MIKEEPETSSTDNQPKLTDRKIKVTMWNKASTKILGKDAIISEENKNEAQLFAVKNIDRRLFSKKIFYPIKARNHTVNSTPSSIK